MKNVHLAIWAFLISSSPCLAESALPTSGMCEYKEPFSSIRWNVTWQDSTATIIVGGLVFNGQVVGLRPETMGDGGFKLSIVYGGGELNGVPRTTELMISHWSYSEQEHYVMGDIGYDYLPSGERVIAYIHKFTDVECAFVR